MDRAIQKTTIDRSSWFWLALMVGGAGLIEVVAVKDRDLGFAISGIGIAFVGAFAFLAPIPLRVDVRVMLRPPKDIDPRVAALAGVGVVLNHRHRY